MIASPLYRRIVNGIAANAFGQAVNVAIQLSSVPVFLQFWGTHLYGQWLIVSAIPAYLGMSDIGFPMVAGNEMTMQTSRGDRAAALATYQSTWALITILSAAILIIVGGAASLLPVRDWLRLTLLTSSDVTWIIVFLTVYLLIGLQLAVLNAGYRCVGAYATGTLYYNISRMAEFGSVVVAVAMGASPLVAAAVFAGARGVAAIFMGAALSRREPWLRLGISAASPSIVRRLAGPAIAWMGMPFGNALSFQGMVTAVGIVLGPVAVVTFSTSRTLSRVAFQFMAAINNSVAPEISTAYGMRDMTLMRKLHASASQAALWGAALVVAALGFTGGRIIELWTSGKVPFNQALFAWLLAVIIGSALWYPSAAVLIATNTHQRMAALYLSATAASLALAYVMMPRFGIPAAGAALLVTEIVMTWYVVRRSLRLTEGSLGSYAKWILRPPIPSARLRAAIPQVEVTDR